MQHREKKHLLFSAKIATNVVSTGVVLVFFPDFNIQIMILSTLVKGTDQTEQPFFFFLQIFILLPFLFRFLLMMWPRPHIRMGSSYHGHQSV